MSTKNRGNAKSKQGVRSTGGSKRTGVQQSLEDYEAQRVDKLIFNWLRHTTFGRILLVLVGFFSLVGINLLIAQGNFDRFTFAMGVEVIAAGLISWLIYAIRAR